MVHLILNTGFCTDPLGMEDMDILDAQLSGSSQYNEAHHAPRDSRLNGPFSWAAAQSDLDQWIQVKFQVSRAVSGVVVQGQGNGYDHWVKGYKVSFSNGGSSWDYVQDANQIDLVRCNCF